MSEGLEAWATYEVEPSDSAREGPGYQVEKPKEVRTTCSRLGLWAPWRRLAVAVLGARDKVVRGAGSRPLAATSK